MSSEFGTYGNVSPEIYYAKSGGSENDKALNKVCGSIYEKDAGSESGKVDLSGTSADDTNQKRLAKDLLKYCSPLVSSGNT